MGNTYQRLYKIGIIGYLLFIILSIVFYKERTFFADISYHLFYIIKGNNFAIQNFRFNAVFTQLFPLLACKAHLSLSSIALVYSVGFIIYYFACYLICGSVLKQYQFALTILFINTLFVTHTFYWIQSELPQGLVLMVLVFACAAVYKTKPNPVLFSLVCVGLFVVGFAHPILTIPLLFVYIFLFLDKNTIVERRLIYAMALYSMAILITKNLFFKTEYESQSMGGVKNIINLFPHYFSIYSIKHFLKNCIQAYYWIPLLSLCIVTYYFVKRMWLKLLIFSTFVLGYLMLIIVSYPDASTRDFYTENLFLPICIFIAIPFVFDVLPFLISKKLPVPLIAVILLSCIIRIYAYHQPYTARLNWEREFLHQHNGEKLIVNKSKALEDTLMMVWGTPYEFWLLSTIENKQTASIIINDIGPYEYGAGLNKQFMATWGVFDYASLPKRYFLLNDTSYYRVIK